MTAAMADGEVIVTSLFVDGVTVETVERMPVSNPAFGERVVGYASAASAEQVLSAIESSHRAFGAWSSLTPEQRADTMARAMAGFASHRDADAAILSAEVGKILHEAWIDHLVFEIRWNLALALSEQVDLAHTLLPESGLPVESTVAHQPLGVVTIIIPFNWPLAIVAASLPHALLAGNTVIVKPPPTAPLATVRVLQRIAEKLPPGVLNVVTGLDDKMGALVTDARIAKVCFTGSVAGGKRIMGLAAENLTRLTLELGGNDAAIVCADAVLDDENLDRMFAAIFDTTGQICMNIKRLLVHTSRMQEVVDGLSVRARSVVLGDPRDSGTTMGPVHTARHRAYLAQLVSEARTSGAEIREFGDIPSGPLGAGHFVRPALVIGPDPALDIVREEQFGPVIPIMPFESEDEAVHAANDTWAGLGASVWTGSEDVATRVSARLNVGYVWVNDHGAPRLDLRAPFGGMKHSGFGREQGLAGIRAFQDTRVVARERTSP